MLLVFLPLASTCLIPQHAHETYNCNWECDDGYNLVNAAYCCPLYAPVGKVSVCNAQGLWFMSCPANPTVTYSANSDNNCITPVCAPG